jgi:DNA mismatch repair protein MutS2
VLGQEEQRMAAIIGALEQANVAAEETRARIAAQAAELEETRAANAQLSAELKDAKLKFAKQAEQMKGQLKTKMDELLVDTKKRLKEKARQSVRKQDEYVKAASKTAALTRRKQDEAESVLGQMLSELELPPAEAAPAAPQLAAGDKVRLRESRLKGVVESLNRERGTAVLLVNGKRLAVKLEQLEPEAVPLAPPPPVRDPVAALVQQQAGAARRSEQSYAAGLQDSSDTLDLHGLTTEEAGELLDEFLSRALLLGLPSVRVMHGIGTGRLRNYVQSYLKRHSSVTNVRFAGTHDGGVGVTLADLR